MRNNVLTCGYSLVVMNRRGRMRVVMMMMRI